MSTTARLSGLAVLVALLSPSAPAAGHQRPGRVCADPHMPGSTLDAGLAGHRCGAVPRRPAKWGAWTIQR